MVILVLFEQFSGKFCLGLWPLILSASPNMMHGVRTVSVLCVLKATQAYRYEEVRNYGKFLFIQSIVKNGWWEEVLPPHPPPGSAPACKHMSFLFPAKPKN